MNEFHLLENIGAGGAMDGTDEPHLHTRDALDDGLCRSLMMKEPNALIQFQVYSDKVHLKFQVYSDKVYLFNCCWRESPLSLQFYTGCLPMHLITVQQFFFYFIDVC